MPLKKIAATALGAILALTTLSQAAADEALTPTADTAVELTAEQRIGGLDRYQVAANISRWLPSSGTKVAIASGHVFADALSVGPLASRDGMPLLLTSGTELPDTIVDELRRKKPTEILISGGPASVSPAVEQELGTIAPVTRVGGPDRYAVAAGIAASWESSNHVVIASGEVFSDALSAGPLASKLGAPLLLTYQNSLPPATAKALKDLNPHHVIVIGGPGTISNAVLREIGTAAGATTQRIGGADRYAVAANVAQQFFSGADNAVIASGILFPDGLTGTPLANSHRAPILLSTGSCTPQETADARTALGVKHTFYLGGVSSVTSNPVPCGRTTMRAALNPPKATPPGEIPAGTPAEEAVYFVPHQDDELISMAGGIIHDINAGRRVHIYLMNAGYWTRVRDQLKLTNEQVTGSRNAELLTSLERLGVPASNVHMLYIQEERAGAAAAWRKAIDDVVGKLGPDVHLRTMSWLDAHPAHYHLAYAMRDRCETVKDCVFFQSPLYSIRPDGLRTNPPPAPPVVTPAGSVYTVPRAQVTAAANAYREENRSIGRYAIGNRSVTPQINWIEARAYSWGHGLTWRSSADERDAANWIRNHQRGTTDAGPTSTTSTMPYEEDA